MTLAQLFDQCLRTPGSPLFTHDKDDFTVVSHCLEAYLASVGRGMNQVNVLELVASGWINGWFEYVYTDYKCNRSRDGKEKTPAERLKWATRYLKCLRKVVNLMIRQGIIPNVDCFSGIERLPDFARKQGVEEPDSVADSLRRLANTGVNVSSGRQVRRTPDHDQPQDSSFPYDFRRVFHASDMYLQCMYCGGIELHDFCALNAEAIDTEARTVRLAWAGIDVKVPRTVFDTLLQYMASPLFGKCYEKTIAMEMERSDLRLFKGDSVFADWLRYARERHLDDTTTRRLVALSLSPEKTCPEDLREAIQKVVDGICSSCNRYRKQWYCIISHKGTAESRFNEIRDICKNQDDVILYFPDRRKDFYFIEADQLKTGRGKNRGTSVAAVLKKYLFACLYAHETELMRQRLDNIRFLRSQRSARAYAVIPYAEMYKLQLVLESAKGSDVQIQMEDEELARAIDLTPLTLKERVRIARPGYESYEAEVVKIGARNHYTVRFPNLGVNFLLTDIPRALIHPF